MLPKGACLFKSSTSAQRYLELLFSQLLFSPWVLPTSSPLLNPTISNLCPFNILSSISFFQCDRSSLFTTTILSLVTAQRDKPLLRNTLSFVHSVRSCLLDKACLMGYQSSQIFSFKLISTINSSRFQEKSHYSTPT